ncbi:helix-turn-helix domain-containing protein [Tumebacillus permanentifrigoris]|uniref:HTH cro/C1-type domain-containing protein n=1 Tax=Tumebacillus permanentifrigoris TaxID=378543 RepID=A0A316DE44_9BACL|nr:helix-turn-helix transcriptional regulator [Tumebacillus permanentifrigoris]PWK15976.1 hypothetical protein C7459_102222 [Tumebacillus permanentifrigoris]
MSTLDATATAVVDKIPLGRRIGEIMEEKGDAFSIRAFSTRIGMNREILRVIIAGERTILPSELERIAEGLGISLERLKQLDTMHMEQELKALMNSKQDLKRALDLANQLVLVARGASEKCISLYSLGKVHYLSQQYDEAHQIWLDALPFAEKIQQKSGENNLYHLVTANLMLSYTVRKEYSNVEVMLKTVESVFLDAPEKIGSVYYTRMRIMQHTGNHTEARKYSYLCLEQFKLTKDDYQIGLALINAADCDYRLGDFETSVELLKAACVRLEDVPHFQIVAGKDLAKTLLKLGRCTEALQIIETYLPRAVDYPDYRGKLLILYSIATNDISYAEGVTKDAQFALKVRLLAYKYLMNHYKEQRDACTLLRYYEEAELLSAPNYDYLEEDEL